MMMTALRPREDLHVSARLADSAEATEGVHVTIEQFDEWFAGRKFANTFAVERIAFPELRGWSFSEETGNLAHGSGRFFTVEGLRVLSWTGPVSEWHQPIINQPEVGILGIVVKEFDGVLHCLMQAKMEPGNPNLLQLAPTVQATRSNYTRVHKGSPVRYIEYFVGPGRGRVIADVLQSEHGSWFYRKQNRNMVVEVTGDVPLHADFCWLTLGQIHHLMQRNNTMNMDSRTVLSCIPQEEVRRRDETGDLFHQALSASRDREAGALISTPELLSWFTGQRSQRELEISRIPLKDVPRWHRTDKEIARADGRYFSIVAVSVSGGSREVTSWSQPLFEPRGQGLVAFVVRNFGGVLHVLVNARMEGGFLDSVELGPTVQCIPWNYDDYEGAERPFLLDYIQKIDPARVRYQAIHSEEGGRFLNAESRYMIVEADEAFPGDIPQDYCWITISQLTDLLRHGHYVNVQARTLVSCLKSLR
jgi:oxidase EvaA